MLPATMNSQSIALLLGGTYCNQENDRQEKSNQVISDFKALRRAFPLAGISVYDEMPFKPYSEKRDSVAKIEAFLEQNSLNFLIYWSGHGDLGSGDWRFSDDRRLSLKELIRLWKKTQRRLPTATLILISDCCSSGAWCYELDSLASKGRAKPMRIVLQAASMENEKAYFNETGSHLTTKMVNLMHHPEDPWSCWAHCYQRPMVVSTGLTLKTIRNPSDSRITLMHLPNLPGVIFITIPNVDHIIVRSD